MADNKVTALETVRQPQQADMSAFEPRNFDEALRIATCYASSALLGEIRSPEAALLIMAVGRELGISSTAALRGIYIIKGKPVLSSDLLVAIVLKRTDICEYFICTASDDESATYETKRKGRADPIRNTFSMTDAKQAGLVSAGGNWQKYPRNMLRHRAAAELARMVYPDITLGLYMETEADELRGTLDVTPAQLVTEPVRTHEPEEESTAVAMGRWKSALFTASTPADCDAVAKEMNGRLVKGTQEHAAMVKLYRERKAELKKAPPVETVHEAQIVDKAPEAAREPGEDG
jgi:hypothetical protein